MWGEKLAMNSHHWELNLRPSNQLGTSPLPIWPPAPTIIMLYCFRQILTSYATATSSAVVTALGLKAALAKVGNEWCVRPRFCNVRLYWTGTS